MTTQLHNYYNSDGKCEKQNFDELVFPNSLDENQKHLIRFHLQRSPESHRYFLENFQTSMDILREEGRVEVREYCALMMIRRGMDVDTIREISRLDLQRILELRSEITP